MEQVGLGFDFGKFLRQSLDLMDQVFERPLQSKRKMIAVWWSVWEMAVERSSSLDQ